MKKYILGTILLLLVSCEEKSPASDNCGDGVLDIGEECDGEDFDGRLCQGYGFYGGELKCTSDCKINTSSCTAEGGCGDNVIQLEFGEECEGNELNNETCFSLGYYSGTLSCGSNCRYDLSDCRSYGKCGDGTVQDGFGEQCDLGTMNGKTCTSLGYYGGQLACTPNCQYDTSECEATGICGDNIRQVGFEECDNSDIGGASCITKGFDGGTLSCTDICEYDYSECIRCGDGEINGNEQCEFNHLDGNTCETLGYYGGVLSCSNNCMFNTQSCETFGYCGDGEIQPTYLEECEGSNLNGNSCLSLGYYGGNLTCNNNCQSDKSDCIANGMCGDGVIQTPYETCDGTNLQGSSCNSIGFSLGTADCTTECTINRTLCAEKQYIAVASSYLHTCAIDYLNKLYCWGNYSALGTDQELPGGKTAVPLPVVVDPSLNFVKVNVGVEHSCAIDSNNIAYCWGFGYSGMLGNGSTVNKNFPTQVIHPTNKGFIEISSPSGISESYFVCAIDTENHVLCWGNNASGQLGLGDTIARSVPSYVNLPVDTYSKITTGNGFACALNSTGEAWCWGRGNKGQLGNASLSNSATPVPVNMPSGILFTEIKSSARANYALTSSGNAYMWGYNQSIPVQSIPVQIFQSESFISKISGGDDMVCILNSTGDIKCSGAQNFNGSIVSQSVSGPFSDLDAGYRYLCTINQESHIYCMGANNVGQLGIGTFSYGGAVVSDPIMITDPQ